MIDSVSEEKVLDFMLGKVEERLKEKQNGTDKAADRSDKVENNGRDAK